MTALAGLAVGIAVGAAVAAPVTWRITYRTTIRRSDIVTYDTHRDWRALHEQADHDHRTAIRWDRALTALRHIHRDVVGDLLDQVADRERTIDWLRRPRHARRSPIPPYGRAVRPEYP